MSDTATLLLVIAGAVVASMAIAIVIVRRSQSRAAATLRDLGTPLHQIAATGLGIEGDEDSKPLRGTGTLVLTTDELAFAQWRPERLVRIPRSAITDVEVTREHLGRTMRTDVLRVAWRDPGPGGGQERAVAFFLRNLTPWARELRGDAG